MGIWGKSQYLVALLYHKVFLLLLNGSDGSNFFIICLEHFYHDWSKTFIWVISFQKYKFHYRLSSLKLPVEGTTGRLWGSCGSVSGRHELTGQCKLRIINTCWALPNIYKNQRETAGSISESFRTFQAICKMSPSLPAAHHPPKLQSHVIRVTLNQLRWKTILFFI